MEIDLVSLVLVYPFFEVLFYDAERVKLLDFEQLVVRPTTGVTPTAVSPEKLCQLLLFLQHNVFVIQHISQSLGWARKPFFF